MLEQKNEGIKRRRVGIRMIESGIPRPRFEIHDDKGEKMGYMTSGTFSPLLKCGIGMAYVKVSQAQKGNTVHVKIRKKLVKGKIVSFPFYDTEKYGYKRKVVI